MESSSSSLGNINETVVIPKVSSSKHLRQNIESMKISLSETDIAYVSQLFKPSIKQLKPSILFQIYQQRKTKEKSIKTLKTPKITFII